jgi:peptidoglycan/LPS O-acetylase OafA/YrhL
MVDGVRVGDAPMAVPDAVAPPTGNPRFPAVDGLRALAALAVVAFHAAWFAGAENTPLGRIASHLDVGVAVFFRRILRIVPGYWVALLVLAPLISFGHPFHFHAGLTASFLLLTLVGGAIAVACAAASYYLVERRALRFKRSGGQAVTASSDGVPEPA